MKLPSLVFMVSMLGRGFATASSNTISKRACFGAGISISFEVILRIAFYSLFHPGCYWGTEKFFKSDFGKKVFVGSGSVVSGYPA